MIPRLQWLLEPCTHWVDNRGMTVLSVNLNKVALLRNSRGGALPDIERAARTCIAAGAGGITLHPRPDQRHARPDDLHRLAAWLPVEFNLEGNPFAGPNAGGYPGFIELVEAIRPAQCTLVPDGDQQITSDHGFEFPRDAAALAPLVERIRRSGARVSVFVDAGATDFSALAGIGVDRIEIYTGHYAHAHARGVFAAELEACRRTAEAARAAGLGVNAGHDLDTRNLGALLRAAPFIAEVSIGHALIDDALYEGLDATVRRYLAAIAAAHSD